jgi:hypothetical protein
MKQLLAGIFILSLATLGCRQIETITTKTTTKVDSVRVSVPLAGHSVSSDFVLPLPGATESDAIVFEDERLRIRIVPTTLPDLPPEVTHQGEPVLLRAGTAAEPSGKQEQPRYRLEAEVKPDTTEVTVAEKTTIIETEQVRYQKQMPWWGWMIAGVAVFALLLLGLKRA